jgi:hypothetical protein
LNRTTENAGEGRRATSDRDVYAFINNLERLIGTYLYGRRF